MFHSPISRCRALAVAAVLAGPLLFTGCQNLPKPPGAHASRTGDEIVAAGQFFHTGTPVVLWMDPGGYDGYRVERRFSAYDESSWETSKVAVPSLTTKVTPAKVFGPWVSVGVQVNVRVAALKLAPVGRPVAL